MIEPSAGCTTKLSAALLICAIVLPFGQRRAQVRHARWNPAPLHPRSFKIATRLMMMLAAQRLAKKCGVAITADMEFTAALSRAVLRERVKNVGHCITLRVRSTIARDSFLLRVSIDSFLAITEPGIAWQPASLKDLASRSAAGKLREANARPVPRTGERSAKWFAVSAVDRTEVSVVLGPASRAEGPA